MIFAGDARLRMCGGMTPVRLAVLPASTFFCAIRGCLVVLQGQRPPNRHSERSEVSTHLARFFTPLRSVQNDIACLVQEFVSALLVAFRST